MTSLGSWTSEARRSLKRIDAQDLQDQLDAVRDYLRDLTGYFGKIADRQRGRARELVADTASDAEETMRANFAALLIVALGVGALVGYMIAGGKE